MINAAAENPWVERFTPYLSKDEIRKKVERLPRPLMDFDKLQPAQSSKEFNKRLEEVFFPSTQCIAILSEWLGLAIDHSQNHYQGRREFMVTVYGQDVPFPDFSYPICLTGLAGVGKSQVLKAIKRLMPSSGTFTGLDNTLFRLESNRILTIQAKASAIDVFYLLTGQRIASNKLAEVARKHAYRDGLSFLGVDEFQFLTQSDKANTRLVQLLMLFGYIGLPVVYISNFSMLYKLLERNQEDRQRLLGTIRGLFPEAPDSKDWATLLDWHKKIAPDVFEFDAWSDAAAIHQLTGGITRAENKLLSIAFHRAMENGRGVGVQELESAYKSRDFAVYRTDIELLAKIPYSSSLQKKHKDLWCPLEIQHTSPIETFSVQRQDCVNAAALQASLNSTEKKALKEQTPKSLRKSKPQPSKNEPADSSKSYAQQLKENTAWFEKISK